MARICDWYVFVLDSWLRTLASGQMVHIRTRKKFPLRNGKRAGVGVMMSNL